MSQDNRLSADDVAALLDSWVTHLRAEHKSPHTIKSYVAGVRAYLRWCAANHRPGAKVSFDRASVQAFIADLLEHGAESATALSRHRSVRRFSAWLAEEHEIPADDLVGLKPPRLDQKIPPELTTEQLRLLLSTCGTTEFHDIRDNAIIRLMTESMVRAGELLAMEVGDVDIRAGTAIVRRGKGGRGRVVPFGPQTAQALDRYVRARRRQKLAAMRWMWIGRRGHMAYTALYANLRRRGALVGVTVHPHMLRATGAIRWREAGGSVPGLLTVAGWTSLEMAQRYVRAAESRLAVDEAHKLGLGDL